MAAKREAVTYVLHTHIYTLKCGRSADGTTAAIKNHYTNNNATDKDDERNKKLSKGFLLTSYVVVN